MKIVRWVCITAAVSAASEVAISYAQDYPPAGGDSGVLYQATVDTGFVFLNEQALAAPYQVEATAETVTINALPVTYAVQAPLSVPDAIRPSPAVFGQTAPFPEGRGRGWGRQPRGRGPGARRIGAGWHARHIVENLEAGAVVVAFPSQPLMFITSTTEQVAFLRSLLEPDSADVAAFLETRGPPSTQAIWREWMSSLTIDPAARAQATSFLEELAAIQARSEAEVRAVRRFHAVAYPITVLGMLLGVVALGHLLKSFSQLDSHGSGLTREVVRATMICLALVVVLSVLDLFWTLLASQAGQMRELNPLGSRFIDDPQSLIVFKSAATLLGCGLLYALRHHRRARQACWWLCLACTVLTFRWVMFNSMFVS